MLGQKGFQGEKLQSAYLLLQEETSTPEKIEKIRTLIQGLDSRTDKTLEKFSKAYQKLDWLGKGEIISLSAEAWPAKTEAEKKRKKRILLFLANWRSLKSEVVRLKKIYLNEESEEISKTEQVSRIGNVLSLAKGPLGIITNVAAVVVGAFAYVNAKSVDVAVKNTGCSPLNANNVKLPVPIPGIKLPVNPIASGETESARLPGLKFDVDATSPGSIGLKLLGQDFSFNTGKVNIIVFNGKIITGSQTQVDLGSSKTHSLEIKCN